MMNKDKEKLDYIIEELRKLPYVSAIILFGSQVSGKTREDSDIDLAIITKNLNRKKELEILSYANDKVEISIFEKLPIIIQFRVIKNGKIIFLKDEKQFHNIKYETIKRYLDFSYYIKNFYKKIIENV